MKTLKINGVSYREAEVKRPIAPDENGGICAQCAFCKDLEGCWQAIDGSADVFGGDCMERDVIYCEATE